MKNVFFFLLFAFPVVSVHAQSWFAVDSIPGPARDDGASFVIGDTAYCGTGYAPWFSPLDDFYAYDMSTDSWFAISNMPLATQRQYATSFTDGEFGYVFGGNNGNNLNDLWRYDPELDLWEGRSAMPDSARSGASSFVLGDTAYIVGGKTSTQDALSEVWAYSFSGDTWTQKNDMPSGTIWRASAVSVQNYGYVCFGVDSAGSFKNELLRYEPLSDTWVTLSSFPSLGRSHVKMLEKDDQIYAMFGIDSAGVHHNDFWTYDPLSDNWSTQVGLPSAGRKGGMAFSNSNFIYYTTGIDQDGDRLKETWKYDPLASFSELKTEFQIYPNPTRDVLYISSDQPVEYARIYASDGKLIKTLYDKVVQLDDLQSGIYMLKINENSFSIRFVKL